jgi:hypothetical protein
MRFALVRGSDACDPDCPEWISAEGVIGPDTPDTFEMLLDALDGRRLPLLIDSVGGDLAAALRMGRLVRQRGLDVAVARTRFVGCTPEDFKCGSEGGPFWGAAIDKGECRAACPLVLAGGARRTVGLRAEVTVHRLPTAEAVAAYLAEMNIAPELAAMMDAADPAFPRRRGPLDLSMVKLATDANALRKLVPSVPCDMADPGTCAAPRIVEPGAVDNRSRNDGRIDRSPVLPNPGSALPRRHESSPAGGTLPG